MKRISFINIINWSMIINKQDLKFSCKKGDVFVFGFPKLKDVEGIDLNNGMAMFWGEGYEMYIANMKTKIIRQFATKEGLLLVDDKDIDYNSISSCFTDCLHIAKAKELCWEHLNRWDGFKKGLCALKWTLYPEGTFFMDEDGFGMENNNEEAVYAIVNMDLEIVVPFQPIRNIEAYLRSIRKHGVSKISEKVENGELRF